MVLVGCSAAFTSFSLVLVFVMNQLSFKILIALNTCHTLAGIWLSHSDLVSGVPQLYPAVKVKELYSASGMETLYHKLCKAEIS